jgi:hypothetical protein
MTRTPKTPEMIQQFLSELERPAKKLSEWELTFLESIREQWEERQHLTDRQFEVLERIYAEKTA